MNSLFKTATLLSVVLLVGRFTGFFRESLIGTRFGTGSLSDVAILIVTLPDAVINLLLAGGFSAALIPALKKASEREQKEIMHSVLFVCFAVFLCIAILIGLWHENFILMLAPSLDNNIITEQYRGFLLVYIALPLTAIGGVLSCFLNATQKFSVPAFGNFIYNIIICFYLFLLFSDEYKFLYFSSFVLFAVFCRLFFLSVFARSIFSWPIYIKLNNKKSLLRNFIFGMIGYGIYTFVPVLYRTFHAINGNGNLTIFNFSLKILDIPIVVFLTPIVIILLPKFSKLLIHDYIQFQKTLSIVLLSSIILILTVMISGFFYIDTVVNLLFGYGKMTDTNLRAISETAKILVIALPFIAVSQLGFAALNSAHYTHIFMINVICALCLSVAFWSLSTGFVHENIQASLSFVVFHIGIAILTLFWLYQKKLLIFFDWEQFLIAIFKLVLFLFFAYYVSLKMHETSVFTNCMSLIFTGLVGCAINFQSIKNLFLLKVE